MRYEFLVSWRYLHRGRPAPAVWLALALAALVCLAGVALFIWSDLRAAGAVMILAGGLGVASSVLLALFSTFTAVSVLGVAIGVSILITVLSVTSGFQREFQRKVLGVNAHVLVLKYGADFSEYRDVLARAEATPGVVAAAPFLFNEMMIARGTRLSGALVKGVDPRRAGRVLDLPRQLVPLPDGRRPPLSALLTRGGGGAPPGIVVGRELARKLDVEVGDVVRLIAPRAGIDSTTLGGGDELPRSRDFRVAALFDSGFEEYDRRLIFVHMAEVQAFFQQGDVVTGVEMKVRDVSRAPRIARRLARALGGSPYRTIDWSELNHNLFTALQVQKVFLGVVIGIIVVVAAFNVLAALAMLVIRKRREIAILSSMGTSPGGIARIFLAAGVLVWLGGTTLGLGWGYLGCTVLARYRFPLDPKVYLIHRLPVQMDPREFALAAAFALVVCLLATLYPALRAARVDPVEGLRYE